MSSPPDALIVNDRLRIPFAEFEFLFARSSGPGGQNVNKVNSKVQLRWHLAEAKLPEEVAARFRAANRRRITTDDVFTISSQRYRDQIRNRADCLEKLAELLQESSQVPRRRRPTRVPRRAHAKRLDQKKQRSETKQRRRKPRLDD